jgi:SAM-dependent methyltransferase
MLTGVTVIRPYEHLSEVYDSGWSDFSKQYGILIAELLRERSVSQARVLDLACGTGALAIDLARRGHTVHGIDKSPEMIKIARVKAKGLTNVLFDVQDMTKFKVPGKFDLVTCTFDSVNYLLDAADVQRMFRRAAASLLDRGLLIFDSNTRNLYVSHSDETQKQELHGQFIIQHCTYNPVQNEATTVFSFQDGAYEVHRQRPYDLEELNLMLANAGLTIAHLFSWFDNTPYSNKTEKLFCVAEKPGL